LVDFKEKGSIMAIRGVVALAVTFAMALGVAPTLAQQTSGVIGGKAASEAREPFSNYTVQLRDSVTGQIVGSSPLNLEGQFTVEKVAFNQRVLVELVQVKQNRTVCTEGPILLTSSTPSRLDVNINCGKVPAAFWILAAGAGTAAAVALAVQSGSQ
jgi:hypothetical protein